ncbi:winged helix-turn-helix domain-containing protein [Amycolatopsis carbonis]|uniref:Winged helix-turn-helix domain-containing protein n=1 Tax=Amycolatopsis carbonis TaxID=715471 RepID=A0A9Y2IMM4_9PSEU|nr:winged helix-turn-helix domain-containing protein [Amycolatopsis sp. 2-15]WIX82709.1 winged helix-turn-helix domain-containing protein [Amycolatopsis sp. 2-15]
MAGDADLARIGFLLSDRNRAAMLLLLLDGRPQPVSALMAEVGISASLASTHLRKLKDGGLVVVEVSGRQRLYRLAGPVADAIEGLLLLAPPGPAKSLRQATRGRKLREARVCYDHLAGSVGVAINDAFLAKGFLVEDHDCYGVSATGRAELAAHGIDVDRLRGRARPLARPCMDWSERRNHLAGSLGAAVKSRLLELGWIDLLEASRDVDLTEAGRRELREWLGVEQA